MYAIVKTGGKQYRVEEGLTLLVERLPAEEGASVTLPPLLFVDGEDVVDGDELAGVSVEATIVAHERGPKLRIVKFKPKRGYKRRTGHRQELTRIRVTQIAKSADADSVGTSAGAEVPKRAAAKKEPVAARSAGADPAGSAGADSAAPAQETSDGS
jgi:large subunit ribosomal protein L21